MIATVFAVQRVTASNDPPNFVWWAECQTDGPVHVCRQGGNQLNLSVRYEGDLAGRAEDPSTQRPLTAHVKLNGRDGVFAFGTDRFASGQLLLTNRFLFCRTDRQGKRYCKESPSAMRALFENAAGEGDRASRWDLEIYFTDETGQRRDDRLGGNFRFRFEERKGSG